MIGYAVAGAVAVVALVLAVLLVAAHHSRRRATARAEEAEAALHERDARLAELTTATRLAEARSVTAETAIGEVRRQLEDRVAASDVRAEEADQRVQAAEAAHRATLQAIGVLWDLSELRQDWVRRTQAQLTTAPPDAAGKGLAGALDLEVTRTREEAGTPGELLATVDEEPSPASALLTLTAVQLLLEAVGRHCDSYHLVASSGEGAVHVALTCEGFDGGAAAVQDARTLGRVLGAAGVRVTVGDGAATRLEAHLEVPAPAGQ
ncbi:MAG TPA: hypothetical protein VKV25_10555 [Acidimicrobiales bacterium]|nr:hypothetical protein [Acidimicrobiales bacterium]